MDYFSLNHGSYQVYIGVTRIEALEVDFSGLTVKDNPIKNLINIGSVMCRKLLCYVQKYFNLIKPYQKTMLHEQNFPYYFVANEKKYQVSFSHSQSQVAVMVVGGKDNNFTSRFGIKFGMKFGIDIEDKHISDAVARRFFCEEELDWLAELENSQPLQSQAKTLLWTLKESLIKANIEETLVTGLKNNVLKFVDKKALSDLLVENDKGFNQVMLENGRVGFSPKLKCGWVIIYKFTPHDFLPFALPSQSHDIG